MFLLRNQKKLLKKRLGDRNRVYEGHFRAYIQEHDNKQPHYGRKLHFERKNLIVNGARKILAHLIGDGCDEYGGLNRFTTGGDNNITPAELFNPAAPTIIDTNLVYSSNPTYHEVVINKGDETIDFQSKFVVSYPNSPNETSVLFQMIVEPSEGAYTAPDPTVYSSAGMWFAPLVGSPILFASQSFPVMMKTLTRTFYFDWEIRF